MAAAKKTITENMKIYEGHREPPKDVLKPITAGRLKGMSDINPMWRIKALTEEFGPCGIGWYYTVDKQWLEPCGNETVAFVNISLFIKEGEEWSKPIFGTGGSKIISMERNGSYVSDEAFKMATTDAISVACKQLGIAADVYWNSDRTKYSSTEATYTPQTQQSDQNNKEAAKKDTSKQSTVPKEKSAEELAAVNPNEIDKDLIPQPGKTITPAQQKKLEAEMERTGIPLEQVLSLAKVDNMNKMSHPTFCAIMTKFSHTKDKNAKEVKE